MSILSLKRFISLAAFGGIAFSAWADTAWIIRPETSASGRMLMQSCREGKPRDLMIRFDPPGPWGKYHHLRIGDKSKFCFAGLNEKGVAVVFTGGDPNRDPKPPKTTKNLYSGHNATVILTRSSANAREAVNMLRTAFKKKLIADGLIFFIADPNRAIIVECSPRHFASWELPTGFCVYTHCWKLPGMDNTSTGSAERAARHYQREWAAREFLRRAMEKDDDKTISVAESLAVARINAEDTGKKTVRTAPSNEQSLDSYLFDLDAEFPDILSCVYVAYGPQRYTVYLPIPMGAADALPPELQNPEWPKIAQELRKNADPKAPVSPALVEFEQKQLQEFAKSRQKARDLLRRDKNDEARQLLRDTLQRQARETLDFLRGLK